MKTDIQDETRNERRIQKLIDRAVRMSNLHKDSLKRLDDYCIDYFGVGITMTDDKVGVNDEISDSIFYGRYNITSKRLIEILTEKKIMHTREIEE